MMSDTPIVIAQQGIFSAGGIVERNPGVFDPVGGQMADAGQTRHADHANVFYQIPADGNGQNIVFLHGYGQSRFGWQGTPDGREGFSDIFLRKGYGVYLVDQPRRGEAGQSSKPVDITAKPDDLNWFTQFRLGLWPNYQEGSQMPHDEASIDQFFRMMTPDTGAFEIPVITDALVKVFERSGPGVLMSHSQGGIPAWFIAMGSDNVVGHIAIEPGTFVFPEGELPAVIPTKYPVPVEGIEVPVEQFEKLTKHPIAVYFGDFIPDADSEVPAWDFWRGVKALAYKFADVVNAHGGDCTVICLPDEGIKGNDHFMFQDLNNQDVADSMAGWLKEKGLA